MDSTVRLDAALGALADPTRRTILERVSHGPRRAGDLARGFRMSRPAVSKHLRVLREAGLMVAEKRGREQLYRLSPRGLQEIQQFVEEASRFWDRALASFKRYAEEGGAR